MHNIILQVLQLAVDPMERDILYPIPAMGRTIIQKITIPLWIKVSPVKMQKRAKSYTEEGKKASKSQKASWSFIIKRRQDPDQGS